MRIPIAYTLAWPERMETPCERLDLVAHRLARLRGARPGALPGARPRPRGAARRAARSRPSSMPPMRSRSRPSLKAGSVSSISRHLVGEVLAAYDAAGAGVDRRGAGDRSARPGARPPNLTGKYHVFEQSRVSLFTILAFLLVIGPLIFVHELGHYFVGRWFGVKADTFSIGFGREIFGWTDKRGTRWKVGWLPLGGYVKFAGDMNPASDADPTNGCRCRPRSAAETFQAKPLWQRFLIVAGRARSPISCSRSSSFIDHLRHYRRSDARRRSSAVAHGQSAAVEAGFRLGDRIVAVDGSGIGTLRGSRNLCRAAARAGRCGFDGRARRRNTS